MEIINDFFKYYTSSNSPKSIYNFSVEHFGWLAVALLSVILAVTAYRNFDANTKQIVLKACAIGLVAIYLQRSLWAASIGRFSTGSMLPFHLCGAMVFLEFVAVFWNSRIIKEFVYCAGLPGAAVALFTPELNGYPLFSFQYQAFIWSHLILVIIPLFWIFGDEYEPDNKYMIKAFLILCIMALGDGIINSILGSNYMFVSKAPANTPFVTIENMFGYKGYLAFLIIAAFCTMKLMYLPWRKESGEDAV